MTLEESLRALATEDEAQVPPRVDAAVMAAWDAARRSEHRPAPKPWLMWIAACAALVLAAALVTWNTTDPEPPVIGSPAPLIQNELVLVPDEGGGPLMLMRVRMTRREFSRLGVPISNPDGNGLVDVEVVVGEDGVARSIRRAVAVGWTGPNP